MYNWCHTCNGRGYLGRLWWRKVCPSCKADKSLAVRWMGNRHIMGYLQKPPGKPPTPRLHPASRATYGVTTIGPPT